MPTSQAQIPTTRAARYLTQLCNHGTHLSRITNHHPRSPNNHTAPATTRSQHSDTDGVIDFDFGRCTLHATDEALTLTAEADEAQNLQRVQDGIAHRLERIGRRDQLTVTWQPTRPAATLGGSGGGSE